MTEDPDHIWSAIQDELRQAVPADKYDLWLAPLRAAGLEGDVLVVESPRELRAFVAERFARCCRPRVAAVLGPQATVEVRAQTSTARAAWSRRRAARAHRRPSPSITGSTPTLTFEQFVIGDANRFAHAAALAVAELPGHAYNPLFIYGPPGVGKTHLLHSIGNYVLAYGGGLTVRYTTVETFTNQFLAALHGKDMDRFKGRYRHADVLLIDDVQFLASKAKTEEEFFHTFNALHDLGSQLVLTSDRLPRDLGALEDRLRERFEAGLVTDIEPPDLATRVAVLRKRAQHDGVGVADDGVLDLLADRAPDSIRALEGALIRVVAFASLTGRPLTSALGGQRSSTTSTPSAPGRPLPPPLDRRSDPGHHRRRLRPHPRGAPLAQPRRAPGLAAAGGDVPRARAHRRDAARHRRALRGPQPHDRDARLQAHRRAHRRRPRGLRLRSATHRAPAPGGSGPDGPGQFSPA